LPIIDKNIKYVREDDEDLQTLLGDELMMDFDL